MPESSPELRAIISELDEARSTIANLHVALRSSRRIGMAVGIIMTRYRLTDDEAFEALAMVSQLLNRKVREISEDVILTGALPDVAIAS